jgi:hypothetical protein
VSFLKIVSLLSVDVLLLSNMKQQHFTVFYKILDVLVTWNVLYHRMCCLYKKRKKIV